MCCGGQATIRQPVSKRTACEARVMRTHDWSRHTLVLSWRQMTDDRHDYLHTLSLAPMRCASTTFSQSFQKKNKQLNSMDLCLCFVVHTSFAFSCSVTRGPLCFLMAHISMSDCDPLENFLSSPQNPNLYRHFFRLSFLLPNKIYLSPSLSLSISMYNSVSNVVFVHIFIFVFILILMYLLFPSVYIALSWSVFCFLSFFASCFVLSRFLLSVLSFCLLLYRYLTLFLMFFSFTTVRCFQFRVLDMFSLFSYYLMVMCIVLCVQLSEQTHGQSKSCDMRSHANKRQSQPHPDTSLHMNINADTET